MQNVSSGVTGVEERIGNQARRDRIGEDEQRSESIEKLVYSFF